MRGKWIVPAIFFLISSFVPQQGKSQAVTEYGKQLEGLKQRQPAAKQKSLRAPATGKKSSRSSGEPERSEIIPATSMPSMLSARRGDVPLYANQDEYSDTVAKLNQGENLIPLAQAYGRGEPWYMVKTQKGAVGWVRSSDVGELGKNP